MVPMRVSLRITAILGLISVCLTLFPRVALTQDRDDNRDREESRRDRDDDGPREGRGGGFPGGGFPGGGFPGGGPGGGPGGPGGGWGGPGGGGPGGGGPGGGWGGPGGGGPGGGWGGRGRGGGGGWGGDGGGGPGGGWGGRGEGGGGWGGGGGGWGGGRGGRGGGFGGFNPADMFARQDRNGDGTIALDEVDERTRGMMQRMAQNMGLSESGPWKLDEIRKSFEDRAQGRDGGGDRGDRRDENSDSKKEATKPLVPGFGMASLEGAGGILVPGFGVTKDEEKSGEEGERPRGNAFARPAAPSAAKSTSPAAAAGKSGPLSKTEERAQKMINSNDANKDGKLQKDEMTEMFFKPKDTNNDGAVTLDELATQLAPKGESKPEGDKTASNDRPRGDRGGDRERESGSSDSGSRKSERFLTAKERLPKGAPDWFVDADEDGDGQVLMAEYTDRWTESKAKEFAGRDLDGDGVITPREATSGRRSRDE